VRERLAPSGMVVAKLRFGDDEVLPEADAFGAVGAGQPFHGVQDGARPPVLSRKRGLIGALLALRVGVSSRPLVLPRKRVVADDRTFEVDVGRELRMQANAEAQVLICAISTGEGSETDHASGLPGGP